LFAAIPLTHRSENSATDRSIISIASKMFAAAAPSKMEEKVYRKNKSVNKSKIYLSKKICKIKKN